jgi:hypothetical protein|tara:strand:+ start:5738 stop:6373 length:636 start_codon:yes stop_codon:yes gene_type:complete
MNLFDKIQKEKYMVIDDFLSKEHVEEIQRRVINNDETFFSFTANSIGKFLEHGGPNEKIKQSKLKNIVYSSQLVHVLWHQDSKKQDKSILYDIAVGSVLYKLLKFQTNFIVHRAKINLKVPTLNTNKDSFDGPHVDTTVPHISLIFYLHDCDGDTFLLNEKDYSIYKRISPKENRLLIFDGNIKHAAGFPISSPYRYIINYNIIPERSTND